MCEQKEMPHNDLDERCMIIYLFILRLLNT